jgi:Lon protease-like protein
VLRRPVEIATESGRYRLSEVLPLESEERQELLEIDDVMNRLQHIQDAIEDVTAEEETPDS